MKNFNGYNADKFASEFKHTELYKTLCDDFNHVVFDKFHQQGGGIMATSRQVLGDRTATFFYVQTLYYLNFLLEKNPKEIYDLGCGWNIFKKYIPNIIGIGAEPIESEHFYADIHDFVDDDFIKGHQNYFDSVFSINALHFHPLREFSKIVNDFYSMIAPGGRGYLACNLARLRDFDMSFMLDASPADYDQYCRSELEKLTHINFIAVDIDFECFDEFLDGNIKLVMEKG